MVNAHWAAMAADEFADRRAAARRLIEAGRATPERAEAELRPFAALACRWGADIPALADEIAQVQRNHCGGDVHFARILVADDLCPPADIRAALIKARDRALERAEADPSRLPRATRLASLATLFGCEPFAPVRPERKAA